MSNWYDNPTVSAERAVLAQKVIFTVPKDIQAEFLVPILTPTNQDSLVGASNNVETRAPSTRSQKINQLDAQDYISSNSVVLTIPKYIVKEFFDEFAVQSTIPKGTEFIITCIGGKTKAMEMRIVGYYQLGEEEEEQANDN